MTDFTCAEFRRRRDKFQKERRQQALPLLHEQLSAVIKDIAALKAHRGERANLGLEEDIKALGFEQQYIQAQISVIED